MSDSAPTPAQAQKRDDAPSKAQAAKACNVSEEAVVDVRVDRTGPDDRPYLVTLRSGSQIRIHGAEETETADADQRHTEPVNFVGPTYDPAARDGAGAWIDPDGNEIEPPDDDEVGPALAGSFDPSDHTVAEVLEHLDGATDAERDRVLSLERDGKARKTILED